VHPIAVASDSLPVVLFINNLVELQFTFRLKNKFTSRGLIFGVSFTLSNISAISWRPVLAVEEARVHGENHQQWASNW
jgi:hypothetical protein